MATKTQLAHPVLINRVVAGNSVYTLGASWDDATQMMVPWWFKEDARGYTGHASAEMAVAAIRRSLGVKARVLKDNYPLIEVERADVDGHNLEAMTETERHRARFTLSTMKQKQGIRRAAFAHNTSLRRRPEVRVRSYTYTKRRA